MIVSYVGLPGSGKTYLMSADILAEMRKHRRSAWVNYPLVGAHYFDNLRQVLNVSHGILAVDELNTIAPARGWHSLPIAYFNIWTQSRKLGIDFWYTTQNFNRVDLTVRGVTNFVWKCRHVAGPFHIAQLFDAGDVERDRISMKPIKTRRFMISKAIYTKYDTMHRVIPKDERIDDDPEILPIFDETLEMPEMPEDLPIIEYDDQDTYVNPIKKKRGRPRKNRVL